MTNNTKKTRATFTPEQKAEVEQMVRDGKTHKEIVDATGVGKGTVAKISAKLKSSTDKRTASAGSSVVHAAQAELHTIKKRKDEIEELMNGKLKVELEVLTDRQKKLEEVIKLLG